jgi:hypothetical protein
MFTDVSCETTVSIVRLSFTQKMEQYVCIPNYQTAQCHDLQDHSMSLTATDTSNSEVFAQVRTHNDNVRNGGGVPPHILNLGTSRRCERPVSRLARHISADGRQGAPRTRVGCLERTENSPHTRDRKKVPAPEDPILDTS